MGIILRQNSNIRKKIILGIKFDEDTTIPSGNNYCLLIDIKWSDLTAKSVGLLVTGVKDVHFKSVNHYSIIRPYDTFEISCI